MHEHGIVRDLVERIQADVRQRGAQAVTRIHLRRGSTFAEGPLRQAFEIESKGTPLEGADLVLEEYTQQLRCSHCKRLQEVGVDDLIGHIFVCRDCGASAVIDEARGLELLDVTTEGGA